VSLVGLFADNFMANNNFTVFVNTTKLNFIVFFFGVLAGAFVL